MTHDTFLDALQDADDLPAGLPEAAASHARGCRDCARVLAALVAIGEDGVDEPAPGWTEAFDAQLMARIAELRVAPTSGTLSFDGARASASGHRRTWRRPALLAAAGMAAAVVIGVVALEVHSRGEGSVPVAAVSPEGVIQSSSPEMVEEALAPFASPAGETESMTSLASTTPPLLLDDLQPSDLGSLEEEFAAELDPAAQRELARRLEEATSS